MATGGYMPGVFQEFSWKHTHMFISHWPELSHMATSHCTSGLGNEVFAPGGWVRSYIGVSKEDVEDGSWGTASSLGLRDAASHGGGF